MMLVMPEVKAGESYTCPVCGKYTFERAGSLTSAKYAGGRITLFSSKTLTKRIVPTI